MPETANTDQAEHTAERDNGTEETQIRTQDKDFQIGWRTPTHTEAELTTSH